MCKEIGVDPLSSKKGFWDEVLGVGDFYYELAVREVIYNMLLDLNRQYLHSFEEVQRRVPGRVRLSQAIKADEVEEKL
jgi:ESCRT-II complex subunit VPS22